MLVLVLELKQHPYFDGINWADVAERRCRPPCEPTEFSLEADDKLDIEQLKIGIAQKIDAHVAERLRRKLMIYKARCFNRNCSVLFTFLDYTFIAPQHQL